MDENSLLAAALRYASNGVYVFPVKLRARENGKKGVSPIGDWDENSSIDPAVIATWWGPEGMRQGQAIAIDTGRSGIVAVDQDVTDGKNGLVEWEKLDPTPTWRVRSPTGGAHDYYRADPEHPVTVDSAGAVADGVDVRGQGGFVFAPPSIDPRGGSWEWVAGEPDWANLPPVPRIVVERMTNRQRGRRKKSAPASPATPALTGRALAPQVGGGWALFGAGQEQRDFGPDGGYKTRAAAVELLQREHREFVALTTEGNARSDFLSQRYGVAAGYGVGVFWTYEWALGVLMSACEENGFADANGYNYALGQAERGLAHGMRTPWIEEPTPEQKAAAAIAVQPDGTDPVADLLAEMKSFEEVSEIPPPRYLIHGLLQFDSESWIIGAPGSKKSFVALDIAARVARGETTWQGRRVNPADVVMIVAEGAGGMGKRVKAWRKRFGDVNGIHVLPRPVQSAEKEMGRTRVSGHWRVLIEACRRLAAGARERGRGMLIVIDTQARVTVGLNENAADDAGIYIEAVRLLKEATGGCVLTIHHTGRTGGDARGSSAIDGAQTTELKVDSKPKSLTGHLIVEKQKDIEEIEPIRLAFEVVGLGQDADGEPVDTVVLAEPGSASFKQAWEGSEAGQGESEAPIKDRLVVEPWVTARGDARAKTQLWIVQVIADTAETLGLTQAECRGILKDKFGEDVDVSTFRKAWQRVTAEDGVWAGLIVPSGGARWTVDRVAVEGFKMSE